jgi:hypothetical protein
MQREIGAQAKNDQRDDERPEIQFLAVPERMQFVWRSLAPSNPEQQQELVTGISGRMNRLGEH